jgi:hypothetical protein
LNVEKTFAVERGKQGLPPDAIRSQFHFT